MRRYLVGRKPKAGEYFEDPYEGPLIPSLTVFERDPSPIDTGLVDSSGAPILAVDEMEPIGFVTFGR